MRPLSHPTPSGSFAPVRQLGPHPTASRGRASPARGVAFVTRQYHHGSYRPVQAGRQRCPTRGGSGHGPLQEQPARHRVQPLRGARPRRRAGLRPLRGGRRRHRPRDAQGGRPPRRERAGRVLLGRRPQPAGLRPADAVGDDARVVQEVLPGLPSTAASGASTCPASSTAPSPRRACAGPSNEMVLGANPADRDVRRVATPSPSCSTSSATTSRRSSPAGSSRRAGTARWCSPSRTPAPTSAPAAPRPCQNDDGTWNITGVKRFITSRRVRHGRQRRPLRAGPPRGRRPGHQGPVAVHRAEVPRRPRDR